MKPPVWALTHVEGKRLNAANFVLRKPAHPGAIQVNGKHEPVVKSEFTSRHASPEEKRAVTASQAAPPAPSAPTPANAEGPLGPWEPSITGKRPYEELSKNVADFLFVHVVQHPDMGEISSRGVQFEIEAKLGTLISKDTNDRVNIPVTTECLLHDNGRVAFRSSMTEAQHKAFNDFLNSLVLETFPRNTTNGEQSRVQIHYKHRREVDKFFELPAYLRDRLPACVQSLIPAKHAVKVRVTYDQKTKEVVAMIVKARIADINIHFPSCPLDCRISINLELAWDGTVGELEKAAAHHDPLPDRNKDRLSYKQSHYQVDLTQVTHTAPGPNNTQRLEKEHELEIEVSPQALIEQGRQAASGKPHQYRELVEGLVDNVRVLARKAREFA